MTTAPPPQPETYTAPDDARDPDDNPNEGVPFEQQTGALMDILRAFHTGHADWPTTRAALLAFNWQSGPPRAGDPHTNSPDYAEWWNDVEDEVGSDPWPDTWGQFDDALANQWVTLDEYMDALRGVAGRADSGQVPVAQPPEEPLAPAPAPAGMRTDPDTLGDEDNTPAL